MKCEVCGNKIKKGQEFCEVCGTPVVIIENDAELEKKLVEEMRADLKSKKADNLGEEKRKSSGSKMVLLVALSTAVCLFILFIVTCFKGDIESYEVTPKLEGVAVYNTNGIIVNSNGEINEQFKNHKDLWFYPTFDHEQALVVDDETCYLVNGNLKPARIGKNIHGAIIAGNSGDVVFSNEDNKTLDYYDAATGEIYHISDNCPRIDYAAISNNGQYVVYYDNKKGVMMKYEKNGHCDALVHDYLYCLAISDDASRAFFKKYEDGKETVIFYHNDNFQIIDRDPSWDYLISNDCREYLTYGNEKAHYFKEGYEEAHNVLAGEYIQEIYLSKEIMGKGVYSQYYIDLPSLEQCIIETDDNIYYFYDGDQKPVNLEIDPMRTRKYAFLEDRVVILNVLDYKLYRTVAVGGDLQKTQFDDITFNICAVECNEDMSSVFITSYDNDLYQLVDGKPVYISGHVNSYDGAEYDKYEKKFFYASDGKLYSITNGEDSIMEEFDDCAKFTYISSDFGDFIGFKGNSGQKYVRVIGNILKVRKN